MPTSRLAATEEQVAKFQALAITDPLTGLPNRRYLELELASRLAEVKRLNRGVGVVFADIDHFKAVNSHGHDVGDVLDTNPADLRAVAEQIAMLVRSSSLDLADGELAVTISLGATLATSRDCVESLLGRADRLMYRSKHDGRDRVTLGADVDARIGRRSGPCLRAPSTVEHRGRRRGTPRRSDPARRVPSCDGYSMRRSSPIHRRIGHGAGREPRHAGRGGRPSAASPAPGRSGSRVSSHARTDRFVEPTRGSARNRAGRLRRRHPTGRGSAPCPAPAG